uniref:E3 SUMO-protein ligase NSE2 n=1 Tax=Periophthalmus magnuspinnatus TaxID=409849 RepID=A0A3B4BCI9_9GOBI
MSLSAVHGTLSSLRSCQNDIKTTMDIVTDVAMDLAETHGNDRFKELQDTILECAKLDRDINHFVDIVQQVTSDVRVTSQEPENMFSLSEDVKRQFEIKLSQLSDAELHNHQKVIAFKYSIKNCQDQERLEELDEDIAVTQSQVNFTCPLTTVEMVNPVKNKKCNHHYDEEAIVNLITNRHSQRKKCRCPVVGCANSDVKESDLVLDQVLRRRIQSQKRNSKM